MMHVLHRTSPCILPVSSWWWQPAHGKRSKPYKSCSLELNTAQLLFAVTIGSITHFSLFTSHSAFKIDRQQMDDRHKHSGKTGVRAFPSNLRPAFNLLACTRHVSPMGHMRNVSTVDTQERCQESRAHNAHVQLWAHKRVSSCLLPWLRTLALTAARHSIPANP
jgi:hypothetical protein